MSGSEKLVRSLFGTATILCAGGTVGIFLFMAALAVPLFASSSFIDLLFGSWSPLHGQYGIFPMLAASVLLTWCAFGLSFPMSLGCAALVSGLAPRPYAAALRRVIQAMTGVPTVVYGFVGVFVLVPLVRDAFGAGSGRCLLTAALMLSLMIAPTMVLFFADAFDSVPRSYLLAASAAGADPVERLVWVMVPCARNGILAGSVLAFGRAVGDTLIALMLAGNAAQFPDGLLLSARTLTAHIALVIAADFESMEFKSIFLCGVILYVITSSAAIAAWRLRMRSQERTP